MLPERFMGHAGGTTILKEQKWHDGSDILLCAVALKASRYKEHGEEETIASY